MKVQTANGVTEQRWVGDPVPEAANWPQTWRLVRNGHLREVSRDISSVQTAIPATVEYECSDCSRKFATHAGMRRHQGIKHRKK